MGFPSDPASGIIVPVVRIGEFDDLHVLAGHAVHPEHQLDALFLLDPPPVVLDHVQALREADLLAFQFDHPVDVVRGAHHHAAAFVRCMRHTQEPGPADVGVNMDGREQAAEADQVVEVVDVVRVPVILALGAQEGVLHADLLVLLPGPAQLLVHIAGRHEGTIGVVHLFPIQWNGVHLGVFERGLESPPWRLRSAGRCITTLRCFRRHRHVRLLQRSFVSAASRTALTYSSPFVSVMTLNSSAGGCALVSMSASNCEKRSLPSSRSSSPASCQSSTVPECVGFIDVSGYVRVGASALPPRLSHERVERVHEFVRVPRSCCQPDSQLHHRPPSTGFLLWQWRAPRCQQGPGGTRRLKRWGRGGVRNDVRWAGVVQRPIPMEALHRAGADSDLATRSGGRRA